MTAWALFGAETLAWTCPSLLLTLLMPPPHPGMWVHHPTILGTPGKRKTISTQVMILPLIFVYPGGFRVWGQMAMIKRCIASTPFHSPSLPRPPWCLLADGGRFWGMLHCALPTPRAAFDDHALRSFHQVRGSE